MYYFPIATLVSCSSIHWVFIGFPHLDPTSGVNQLEGEQVQTQRRSPMLDENRTDTLIASDLSLHTDSIIRGEI